MTMAFWRRRWRRTDADPWRHAAPIIPPAKRRWRGHAAVHGRL